MSGCLTHTEPVTDPGAEAAHPRAANEKPGICRKQITIARPLTLELGATLHPSFRVGLKWHAVHADVDVAKSHDRRSNIVVWECTAGSFEWHYDSDETIVIVEGEVFITNGKAKNEGWGPAIWDFFPAGTSCRWRVPEHVRKVAVLCKPTLASLGICAVGME